MKITLLSCKDFVFTGWVGSSGARRHVLGTQYDVVISGRVWRVSYLSSISTPYYFGCCYTMIPISYVNICVLYNHSLGSKVASCSSNKQAFAAGKIVPHFTEFRSEETFRPPIRQPQICRRVIACFQHEKLA